MVSTHGISPSERRELLQQFQVGTVQWLTHSALPEVEIGSQGVVRIPVGEDVAGNKICLRLSDAPILGLEKARFTIFQVDRVQSLLRDVSQKH